MNSSAEEVRSLLNNWLTDSTKLKLLADSPAFRIVAWGEITEVTDTSFCFGPWEHARLIFRLDWLEASIVGEAELMQDESEEFKSILALRSKRPEALFHLCELV
jgi:hypothetical protein